MTSLATPQSVGRCGARRLLVAAVVSVCVPLPGAHLAATGDRSPAPEVTVRQEAGAYQVMARFEVPQPPSVVLAVLTDYEQIPRYMPDVRTSVVLERSAGRFVVEQEAVSQFMMFSKKVHLVLDVTEGGESVRFVDRCGRSFKSYRGSWTVVPQGNGSSVTYELSATPAFEVPGFILKRLLKRDSGEMIGRLRTEFAARANH